MAWELHEARNAFARFSVDWDHLNQELFENHPYFDSRFIGPLLEFFSTGNEVLCIHRDNGQVTGALILQPCGCGRWASFRPSQAQITAVLLSDITLLHSLFKTLPGFVWSIDLIAIDPRYAPHVATTRDLSLIAVQAYTIGIDGTLSYEDYWKSRSRNLRANQRRYQNRLTNEHIECNLLCRRDPTEIPSAVNRFGELESAGWKGKEGTAVSPDNAQGLFYKKVMAAFAARDNASIYELTVDDKLVASRLLIENANLSIILKTTYDENFSRIAPGRIQLNRVIERRLSDNAGQTIEFYTNATREQREWATFGCVIVNVQVFRRTVFSTALSLIKGARNVLKRGSLVESHPEGWKIGASPDIDSLRSAVTNTSALFDDSPLESSQEWFALLQKTVFQDDKRVRYYYLDRDDQSLAVLPVLVQQHKGLRKIESLGNFYTPLYQPIKSDKADFTSLKYILTEANKDSSSAHIMQFSPMDPESVVFHELYGHLLTLGWAPFRYFCFGNWYLKEPKTWEVYLKQRSTNLRSKIKRKTRRFLEAEGTLGIVADMDGVETAISDFQETYSASWKTPEPYPDFIPALIRLLASGGKLRLGIGRLNGKPIAAQLWIVESGKASMYKVAYDEEYASYSPGTILTAHMLQHVLDKDRVKEVDFLIGDDEYKRIWMDNRRERWGIVAYNLRTLRGISMAALELLGGGTRNIRQKVRLMLNKKENGDSIISSQQTHRPSPSHVADRGDRS